jgi:hypothetical protein
MKGRLFPSYEYRLFIRDRRHDSAAAESPADSRTEHPARRDTVMMTAKNRGRKHQESAGVLPAPGASKKGVNNYYLYMPQHVDVDTHYRAVNKNSASPAIAPNGASGELRSKTPGNDATVLLGRLQSNFIGTEFQIFTPTVQKHPVVGHKPPGARHPASSDSESDYDGASSDNTPSAPRRRNRFHRRRSNPALMRRSNRENASELGHQPQPISEEESVDGSASPTRRRTKRAYSLPNFSYRKSTRSSRRAVANSVDPQDSSQDYPPLLYEEEDGAITYTANLLGNRPRIMDVCVPKVSNEGVAGAEWNRYLGSVEDSSDTSGNSMLNHFRQLQQRLENPDHNGAVAAAATAGNANGVNVGGSANGEQNEEDGETDYTPPDDFGLLALQNRPPWWNVELGAFVLNFGGRVSVASVKNFQLCDRNDQDHIMLQFGRIQGRHSFTMDFQHPLTAVQAFAIAISSLQSRISFG